MKIKYSKSLLAKLEDLISESNFILRYEKGNFKSGYCILNENSIIIVNKYYTLEGKINCLFEIIQNLEIKSSQLTGKSIELLHQIKQTKLVI